MEAGGGEVGKCLMWPEGPGQAGEEQCLQEASLICDRNQKNPSWLQTRVFGRTLPERSPRNNTAREPALWESLQYILICVPTCSWMISKWQQSFIRAVSLKIILEMNIACSIIVDIIWKSCILEKMLAQNKVFRKVWNQISQWVLKYCRNVCKIIVQLIFRLHRTIFFGDVQRKLQQWSCNKTSPRSIGDLKVV